MSFLKFFIICSILMFNMTNASAELIIKNFIVFDYKTAKNSPTFLKFVGKSTKLGIVTTKFEGYAKKFSIAYNLNQNKLEQVKIKIDTKSFDTNSQSRNEKMNLLCLMSDKYTEIVGTTPSIDLNILEQIVVVDFLILGQIRKTPMKFSINKSADAYNIKINGTFSLKDWNIPDPSILIAKVHDQFEIEFEIKIN